MEFLLSINENRRIGIKFTDQLGEKDTYKKGFEFFKQIILDLNEESDLLFIYLQIYSGYGLDLINKKRCFKMSMIPIEDIKSEIIETIPKYFYTYFSEEDNYIAKDPITQVISFNKQKLFSYIIENNEYNKKSENNNIMNVTIGMLHESGQERLDGNTAIQEKDSPLFLNKNFEFVDQYYCDENQKVQPRNIIDYFLHNSSNNMAYKGLISSFRSNELMNKDYFIGDLKNLNSIANIILSNPIVINVPNEDDKLKKLVEIGLDI